MGVHACGVQCVDVDVWVRVHGWVTCVWGECVGVQCVGECVGASVYVGWGSAWVRVWICEYVSV